MNNPLHHRPAAASLAPGAGHRALLLAGLLVGFALRLVQLGAHSLWYDETVSVYLARLPLEQLIRHTAGDIHPPGYYLLLHLWQRLTEPTLTHGFEFLYVWPSLWAGMLILALLYALGRRLFTARLALLAVWLAALHPFQLWYSQEARMYTVGGVLGLLSLWATLRWRDTVEQETRGGVAWLALYALAVAAGMYTLYYFVFLWLTLNLAALGNRLAVRPPGASLRLRPLLPWLTAQLAALLLWSPWLPIAWRQAIEPPVPPWRVPWQGLLDLQAPLVEGLAALLIGQTPPLQPLWPWAAITLLLLAASVHYAQTARRRRSLVWILAYLLLPFGLLLGLSAALMPLYHVRYLSLYAPPFSLLTAAAVLALPRRPLQVAALTALLASSGLGLYQLWHQPAYARDDHRQAVADLATRWRPGDLILVNAGWAYTALTVYWPTDLVGAAAALPPPISQVERLIRYQPPPQPFAQAMAAPHQAVTVLQSGSIDGPPILGWNRDESDFYASPWPITAAALTQATQAHSRIWHYRLYDTVSDPVGQIRQWLAEHARLTLDLPYTGRDFLRVQLFVTTPPEAPSASLQPQHRGAPLTPAPPLLAEATLHSGPVAAGETLYAAIWWQALPALQESLSTSLRLYGTADSLAAQQDSSPLPPTDSWPPGTRHIHLLALPIPSWTPPGTYSLRAIVYNPARLQPVTLPHPCPLPGCVELGTVQVLPPKTAPQLPPATAAFDYLDLLSVQLTPARVAPGGHLTLQSVWRPRPSPYQETYAAVVTLRDPAGYPRQSWRTPLGGWDYPSGQWLTDLPVRDFHTLELAADLPPGHYTATLGLERITDGATIPAHRGWLPWLRAAEIPLRQVTVESGGERALP